MFLFAKEEKRNVADTNQHLMKLIVAIGQVEKWEKLFNERGKHKTPKNEYYSIQKRQKKNEELKKEN